MSTPPHRAGGRSQRPERGPRPGKAQRRGQPRQGRNHTLYVFDQDWTLIEELSTDLGWTYGRVHGTLLRFLLAGDRRTVSTLGTALREFEERESGSDPTPGSGALAGDAAPPAARRRRAR